MGAAQGIPSGRSLHALDDGSIADRPRLRDGCTPLSSLKGLRYGRKSKKTEQKSYDFSSLKKHGSEKNIILKTDKYVITFKNDSLSKVLNWYSA
jgi:hypothetical protein